MGKSLAEISQMKNFQKFYNFRLLEPFDFHQFAPISVLLDAFLRFTYTPTATTLGGGGYSNIVLLDNQLH